MRHRQLIAAAIVLTFAACDGVGGDDGGPLSKGDFVEQANEICAESRTDAARIAPPSGADPIAVEQAVAQTIAIQRRSLRELRDMEPPSRDAPGVQQWLRQVDRAIDEMEALREGLVTGDRAAIADATANGASFADAAEEFADAYGLDECSTSERDAEEDQ